MPGYAQRLKPAERQRGVRGLPPPQMEGANAIDKQIEQHLEDERKSVALHFQLQTTVRPNEILSAPITHVE